MLVMFAADDDGRCVGHVCTLRSCTSFSLYLWHRFMCALRHIDVCCRAAAPPTLRPPPDTIACQCHHRDRAATATKPALLLSADEHQGRRWTKASVPVTQTQAEQLKDALSVYRVHTLTVPCRSCRRSGLIVA